MANASTTTCLPPSPEPRNPPTRAYVSGSTAEGLSKTEIIRCLKHYVAREVYPYLRPAG